MARLKHHTPWHPLFATLLRLTYKSALTVLSEYPLSDGPVRGDVLLIRKEAPLPLSSLPAIATRLGQRTLLEFKSPTDRLERLDLPILIGYGCFLEAQGDIADPRELHLMVVASGVPEPYQERVRQAGGHLIPQERGVYLIDGLMYTTYLIDAGQASEIPGNGLLYPFSRGILEAPQQLRTHLDREQADIVAMLCQHIRQLRSSPQMMHMKDREAFDQAAEAMVREFLSTLTPSERLQGLRPEERLQGLRPEERLQGLRPEEVLESLSALKGLTPEQHEQLRALLRK